MSPWLVPWAVLLLILLLEHVYKGCVSERGSGPAATSVSEPAEGSPGSGGGGSVAAVQPKLFAQSGRAACADRVRNAVFAGDGTQEETESVLTDLAEEAVCGLEPSAWYWKEGPAYACAWAAARLDTPTALCVVDAVETVCDKVAVSSEGLVSATEAYQQALLRWGIRTGVPDPPRLLRTFPTPTDLRTDLSENGGKDLLAAVGKEVSAELSEGLKQVGPLPLLGAWWPECAETGMPRVLGAVWRRWVTRLPRILLEPDAEGLGAFQDDVLEALGPKDWQAVRKEVWRRVEDMTIRHGKTVAKWPPEDAAWHDAKGVLERFALPEQLRGAAEALAGAENSPLLCSEDTQAFLKALLSDNTATKSCLAERLLRWRWMRSSARDDGTVLGQILKSAERGHGATHNPSSDNACRLVWARFPFGIA